MYHIAIHRCEARCYHSTLGVAKGLGASPVDTHVRSSREGRDRSVRMSAEILVYTALSLRVSGVVHLSYRKVATLR